MRRTVAQRGWPLQLFRPWRLWFELHVGDAGDAALHGSGVRVDRMRERHPGMSVLVATAYMEEAESFDWLARRIDDLVSHLATRQRINTCRWLPGPKSLHYSEQRIPSFCRIPPESFLAVRSAKGEPASGGEALLFGRPVDERGQRPSARFGHNGQPHS
jgi:hypothetical protein